jgi:Tfp pilus assembly protein PilV
MLDFLTKKQTKLSNLGFTLVEVMVSSAVMIVMIMIINSFLFSSMKQTEAAKQHAEYQKMVSTNSRGAVAAESLLNTVKYDP